MKKLTCGDCEHWEPAQKTYNIGRPVNDSAPDERAVQAGWCYAEPPKPMVSQVQDALGQPKMQMTILRPPVEDTEKACGSWELSSELDMDDSPDPVT